MTESRFKEKITPYLRDLAKKSEAIKTIYFYDEKYENIPADLSRDLFFEKELTTAKGLVQKYDKRVLFLLSYTCAANCRYCERQDRVGVGLDNEGRLQMEEIEKAIEFIKSDPTVDEVIFSGGDPLGNPKGLAYATKLLAEVDTVKVLRIHTRFLLQAPNLTKLDFFRDLVKTAKDKTYYFSIHIDHPDELTPIVCDQLQEIRSMGYIMVSQSVFLKGVNNHVAILEKLFQNLLHLGIRPYYIYHCQTIPTTKRFVMTINEEVEIMSKLRKKISGLAFPNHVVELPYTSGKLIVPTNHWDTNLQAVKDFEGNTHTILQPGTDQRESIALKAVSD